MPCYVLHIWKTLLVNNIYNTINLRFKVSQTLIFLVDCPNGTQPKKQDVILQIPSTTFLSLPQNAPLPPVLQRQNKVPASAHFSLTSHTEHDRKPLNGPLYNEIHSKAPAHWTTHFLNELAQKVRCVCVCVTCEFFFGYFGRFYLMSSCMSFLCVCLILCSSETGQQ